MTSDTAAIDFGLANCGGTPPAGQVVTLTNNTAAPVQVTASISGSSEFLVGAGVLGDGGSSATLAVGASEGFLVSPASVPVSSTAGVGIQGTVELNTTDPGTGTLSIPVSITPQGATLVVAPPIVTFGEVYAGSPGAQQSVVLTNTGNVAVAVTVGAPSDTEFSVSSAGTVPADGGSVTLTATFTPTDGGNDLSTASLTTDPSVAICGTSANSIGLSGEGVVGAVAVSGNLSFGPSPCGAAAPSVQQVTITNNGTEAFTFQAALAGTSSVPYQIDVTNGTVQPGQSATINVTPPAVPSTSAVPGNYNDQLTISTDVPTDTGHTVSLTEQAQGALLAFDTSAIAFQSVAVGSTAQTSFNVENSGNAPAHVTLSVVNNNESVFSVSPTSQVTVAAGTGPGSPGSQGATASFSPTDITTESGALSAAVDATTILCAPLPVAIGLSGTGLNGGVSISNNSLSFGALDCGGAAAAPQTFTLTNTGNASLTFTASLGKSPSPYGLNLDGGASGSSSVTDTVAAGATDTFTVIPAAIPSTASVTADAFADTITLVTDVVGDSSHAIALHESAQGAILAFNPTALNFGFVTVNSSATLPSVLGNAGNLPANVTFGSSNATYYTVSPTTGTAISGGGNATVDVRFSPGTTTTNEPGNVFATVADGGVLCSPLPAGVSVQGSGGVGVVTYSPGALSFGGVNCGAAAAVQTITFSNSGPVDYHITSATLGTAHYTVTAIPGGGLTVPANGSVQLTVTPAVIPATIAANLGSSGFYNDTLTVKTDVPGDTAHAIALSEQAQGAIVGMSPTTFNFGTVSDDAQGNSSFTVTNTGNLAASFSYTTSLPTVFSMDSGTVQASSTASPVAHFDPTLKQTYNGTASLAVSNTVLCQPLPAATQNNGITLTGVGAAQTVVSVSPTSLPFGAVGCGTVATAQTVVVSNGGLTTISYTATLSAGTNYTVSAGGAGSTQVSGSILANSTVTLTVTPDTVSQTATPGSTLNDTLVITTTAPNDTAHNVAITESASGAILGFYTPGGSAIAVQSVSHLAGNANVDVRNTGNLAVTAVITATNTANPGEVNDFEFFGEPVNGGAATLTNGQSFAIGIIYVGPESGAGDLGNNVTMQFTQLSGPVCQPLPLPSLYVYDN